MASVIVDIECTTYYTASLYYGESCAQACENTVSTIYYSNCTLAALNVGCKLFTSANSSAPLGYYSDGTSCYQYEYSGSGDFITSKTTCQTVFCYCLGFDINSCTTACNNYNPSAPVCL